jgi:hypothetical protein
VKDGNHHDRLARLNRGLALCGLVVVLFAPSCATLSDKSQPLVPTRHQIRSGPFLIFSNTPMADEPQAVDCLRALERDLKQHLDFRPNVQADPVEIYVLDDRNAFAHFLKFYYPELPPRRAFFLAQGDHRVVYTYSSPRLAEDLRHEATHALLHGSFGALPLWLDEGLAEYFESDLSTSESERERIDHLIADLKGGWSPDLARLQSLSDIRQMTPRDYREAWAWVHLFLTESNPAKVSLSATLVEFGARQDRLQLANRLAQGGATKDRLQSHVRNCQTRFLAGGPPPAVESSVRLQDRVADSTPNPADPRGLFRRIRAWVGF